MASSSTLRNAASVSHTGAPAELPADALFEVLLRLPAKDLCRLRAVCRSWRALTSDPHFAALHKSRHAEPLFAVTFRDGDVRSIAIVSLSGQILRRIRFASDRIELLLSHLVGRGFIRDCDPLLVAWVVIPGTGVDIDSWVSGLMHICRTVTYAFAQVASTRDYKVLRISLPVGSQSQLCDIITLDGSSLGRWRRKQNPPIQIMEYVAVNGVMYFLFDYAVMEPTSIAPFDLDTEKWMPTLRGPEPLRRVNFRMLGRVLSLANLNGSLVMIDNVAGVYVSQWFPFLMDHKRGIWVKRYRISVGQELYPYYPRPLLILDDGRIVIFETKRMLLQFYDPRTGNLANMLGIRAMGLGESQSISVYTGSLLI